MRGTVVFLVVCEYAASCALGQSEPERIDVSKGCGVTAAVLFANRIGSNNTTYAAMERWVDADKDGVSSMREIRRGLEAHGVPAISTRIRGTLRVPAIIHLIKDPFGNPTSHFVYVEPQGEFFTLYYAPIGVLTVAMEDLSNIWDGYAVVSPPESNVGLWSAAIGALGLLAVVTLVTYVWRRVRC